MRRVIGFVIIRRSSTDGLAAIGTRRSSRWRAKVPAISLPQSSNHRLHLLVRISLGLIVITMSSTAEGGFGSIVDACSLMLTN